MLRAENISYAIGNKTILQEINTRFLPGEFNMILGPNGSGKSSFLKLFSGEINDYSGNIFYTNENLRALKPLQLARQRAVMSQQPELGFPLSVEEVVMMGRYPHFAFNPSPADETICNEVMDKLQLQGFRGRDYLTLSGGEKQRVQFARLLAQVWTSNENGYRYIFLDEPLNNLDINFQQEFLQIARSMADEQTVLIAVMHDINIALEYADQVFFLKNGAFVSSGKPAETVTEKLIEQVFDVKVHIISNPFSNAPMLVHANTRS